MATMIRLGELVDGPGDLSVFAGIVPGSIQRAFYIYGAGGQSRGGHRHHQSSNILVCLRGKCRVYCNDGEKAQFFVLDDPRQCLVIHPRDWHVMDSFTPDAILLVLSNQFYNEHDYIYEPYVLESSPSDYH